MSDKLQQVKALLRGIRTDDEQYQVLRQQLEQQRLCMIRRDSDALLALNEQIMQHYEQLSASSKERHALLQTLGVSVDHQGIETVFNWLPAAQQQAAKTWWSELESHAKQCKTYNEKNGDLLMRQYEFVQSFLGTESDFLYQP